MDNAFSSGTVEILCHLVKINKITQIPVGVSLLAIALS